MPKVEMFFDHTCPYCNQGHAFLMEVLPKFPSVQITWCPVEAHPKVEEPEHKPWEDLAVQGALYIRQAGGDELAYHERLYKAMVAEKLVLDDIDVLTRLAGEIGADEAAFQKALREGTFQKAQAAANDYAYEVQKVWAVPTFVCGEKRLDAVPSVGVTKEQLEEFLGSL